MTLDEVVAEFESCGATPEGAHDQCVSESARFRLALIEVGIFAEIVSGFRVVTFLDGIEVITNGHVAVRVGDVVYDWTARQFDPDAKFPAIMTVPEWEAAWPSLSERPDL